MTTNTLNYLISTITLEVEGTEISIESVDLHELSASYMINGIPNCVISLVNNDKENHYSSFEEFAPLKEIKVYVENEVTNKFLLFDGLITKLGTESFGREMLTKIHISHPIFKLKRRKVNRIFDNNIDGILEKIIIDNGLNFSGQGEASSSENTQAKIIQYQQTDLNFLLSKALQVGKMINATQEEVELYSIPDEITEKLIITPQNTFNFNVYADVQSVYDTAMSFSFTPEESIVDNESSEVVNIPIGNISSADVVEKLDGDKPKNNMLHGQEDKETQKNIATNQILRSNLSQIKGGITIEGRDDLKCGDFLKIEEAGEQINSLAFVYSIDHFLENDIWKTTLYFGYPDDENAPEMKEVSNSDSNLHYGIVKEIVAESSDEVSDKYLVKVELPLMMQTDENIEVEPEVWARISSMFAGQNHGVLWMPEQGDEVIVGFLGGHFDNAVILGSLFKNSDNHPHLEEEAQRAIVTKKDLKIVFDDANNLVEIRTPSSMIQLDEENGILTSAIMDEDTPLVECIMNNENQLILRSTDGEITLEGDKINILGTSEVNIQSENDLTLNGEKVTHNASGKMTVEASKDLDLKGKKININ